MRERFTPYNEIAQELKISVTQTMTLETARMCIIKYNGNVEKVAQCLKGEIDP